MRLERMVDGVLTHHTLVDVISPPSLLLLPLTPTPSPTLSIKSLSKRSGNPLNNPALSTIPLSLDIIPGVRPALSVAPWRGSMRTCVLLRLRNGVGLMNRLWEHRNRC